MPEHPKRSFGPHFDERRRIVGVLGSGSERHEKLARPAGETVARLGCHLLTGGGAGVMAAASEAFAGCRREGALCLGILRAEGSAHLDGGDSLASYRSRPPNPWVDVPVYTHLPLSSTDPLSRNHINVLSADVVLALPGGGGTLSEVELAAGYGWPLVLFLGDRDIAGRTANEVRREVAPAAVIASEADLEPTLRRLLGG